MVMVNVSPPPYKRVCIHVVEPDSPIFHESHRHYTTLCRLATIVNHGSIELVRARARLIHMDVAPDLLNVIRCITFSWNG